MPITQEFVEHWFRHHALSRATSTTASLAQRWIEDASSAYEDFPQLLRTVSLEALADADASIVRRAIIALALVGHADDIPHLATLAASASEGVAAEARASIYELRRRAG